MPSLFQPQLRIVVVSEKAFLEVMCIRNESCGQADANVDDWMHRVELTKGQPLQTVEVGNVFLVSKLSTEQLSNLSLVARPFQNVAVYGPERHLLDLIAGTENLSGNRGARGSVRLTARGGNPLVLVLNLFLYLHDIDTCYQGLRCWD